MDGKGNNGDDLHTLHFNRGYEPSLQKSFIYSNRAHEGNRLRNSKSEEEYRYA